MTLFQELDNAQQNLMLKHLQLVIDANKTLNLTRIDSLEEGKLLHIEDSLSALPEIEQAPQGLYCDLGTGGGFPGIPIAIATGRKTLLADTRKKKVETLGKIVEELGLANQVELYAGRAEQLARNKRSIASVITARALSKLSVIMELASPLLKQDGLLVCYKSHIDKEEYSNARRVEPLTGLKLVSDRSFTLGEDEFERRIVTYRKTGKAQAKLPRQDGFAQKKPL